MQGESPCDPQGIHEGQMEEEGQQKSGKGLVMQQERTLGKSVCSEMASEFIQRKCKDDLAGKNKIYQNVTRKQQNRNEQQIQETRANPDAGTTESD